MKAVHAVVVDDSQLIRELVVKVLNVNDIKTYEAFDADTALKIIKDIKPRLVVLDIMLPGKLDGIDICGELRQDPKFKNLLIVMITASDKKNLEKRALKTGADILIRKPFAPKELWMKINELLKKKNENADEYKIFVLDDEEIVCKIAEETLTREGYDVLAKTGANGAYKMIVHYKPDLVLLDVMMPGISGDQFADIIKSDKNIINKPKIIYYSNKSKQELRELVEKTNVESFVCKIDGPKELLKTVKEVLK